MDFYDIHFHLLNLSHPNLISFIKRVNIGEYLFILSLPIIGPLLSSFFYTTKKKNLLNTLSFMDKDIAEAIKSIEQKDILPLFRNGLKIEDITYEKIIFTPLMIDFGQKYVSKTDNEIWYNEGSHKAIKNQVIDLFGGISDYFRENMVDKINIFPFLGINTKNYDLEDELDEEGNIKTMGIKTLLKKYFGDYTSENINKRREKLIKNMGKFKDIDSLGNYAFAGIKLYPPVGFDPWPEDEREKEKVRYLYSFCMQRKIPITTHCGVGGFQIIDTNQCKIIASPKRWREVLKNYPDLKLNLAHFSNSISDQRKDIVSLILDFPSVYTDLAYVCFKEKNYEDVENEIKKLAGISQNLTKLYERILFGSDFSISLLETESYRSYLKPFVNTKGFKEKKFLLCCKNPERFLF